MRLFKCCVLLAWVCAGAACTEVLPRQRGNLALPQMAFTVNAQLFSLRQHTAYSKEAAAGGYGSGSGGCGCN